MIELSPRLKMVAGFARKDKIAADIGTDHAYLPAYLVINGIAPKALAYDIRKGPILNAEKTIEKYNLSDRIITGLSDGLNNVTPGSFDDLYLCGMGGNLISDILTDAEWIKDKRYRLILQPQSHAEDVRLYLINNGFRILNEDICFDDGKMYSAMCAEFNGKQEAYKKSFIYTGIIPEISSEFRNQYLMSVYKRLSIKRKAASEHNTEYSYEELNEIIKEIEEYL